VQDGEAYSFYLTPAAGGEAELMMHTTGSASSMYDWTPDGTRIVYYTGKPASWFLLDPKTRRSTPLISRPRDSGIGNAVLSPDKRWLAFRTPAGRRKSNLGRSVPRRKGWRGARLDSRRRNHGHGRRRILVAGRQSALHAESGRRKPVPLGAAARS